MKKGILFRCRNIAAVVMAFAMTLSYLPQQGISAYAKDGSVTSQSQVTVISRECSCSISVKKIQSVNGLYADGEAGIKTLSVLYKK